MYDELLQIYKQEIGGDELVKLSADFYNRLADYIKRLNEEGRMLDRRTVKANLLRRELQNVKQMVLSLIQARYTKIIKMAQKMERPPSDYLTVEEKEISKVISLLSEQFQNLASGILKGRIPKVEVAPEHKRTVLRFLAVVPSIIGSDMTTYGPFEIEDLASLPIENARILVKQGSTEYVETT